MLRYALKFKKGANMSKKILVVSCIMILLLILVQCDPDDPEHFNPEIQLPFVKCTNGVSASSAIATWSAYDGIWGDQDVILSYIINNDGTINHTKMVGAIDSFTFSAGWKAEFPATDNGQNQAISGIVECLEQNCCSILPLINEHYVPVVSAHGQYVNGEKVAQYITFHAYNEPDQGVMVNALKNTFYKPINGKFIAFLGRKLDMTNGLADYKWFIENGGTYYGAPKHYVPSDSPIFPIASTTRNTSNLTMNDLTDTSSPSFVPYPNPKTKDQIIEDLRYGIEKVFLNKNAFEYSMDKIKNPLQNFLQKNSSMAVQKIVKVENRIVEMTEAFSYLIILFDKKTKDCARVSITADGLLHSFAVISPRARVKPLKSENEIIALLTTKAAIWSGEISQVDLMAYGVIYASPICPIYRVTLKDGSNYFVDYNENIFKKEDEKKLLGDSLAFIDKETSQLKYDEKSLYDSIDDKLMILRRI